MRCVLKFSWALALSGLSVVSASAERIAGNATIGGVPMLVELDISDDLATLRHRPADNSAHWTRYIVHGPDEALPILADERLAFLWAPLEKFGGSDLSRLRDLNIARTRQAWMSGKPSTPVEAVGEQALSRQVRTLLRYVRALAAAGRYDEAIALIEPELARSAPANDKEYFEHCALADQLATLLRKNGDSKAELAVLTDASARLGASPYGINIRLKLAARLAEQGRHAESLDMSDAARAEFLATAGRGIPNALPQFDWVRACALRGLGRGDEARALMEGVAEAEQVSMRRVQLPVIRDHEQRAFQCMKDAAGLASLWRRDTIGPAIGSATFVLAQPGARAWTYDPATVDAARATFSPVSPVRILPKSYTAALRNWR